jgi:hypothetical protein
MQCVNCKKLKGHSIIHTNNECPLAKSILCRRCHHRGHLTSTCIENWAQWERPTTLEELIPADIRKRYGIISHTVLEFPKPRGSEGTDIELGDINEIVIPDDYKLLKDFIESRNIKVEKVTKPSYQDCIKAISSWGITHGYRIVIKNEVQFQNEDQTS